MVVVRVCFAFIFIFASASSNTSKLFLVVVVVLFVAKIEPKILNDKDIKIISYGIGREVSELSAIITITIISIRALNMPR